MGAVPGLSTLLPATAAVSQWRTGQQPDGETAWYPGEEATVSGAVPSRRREFLLGRTCARRSLRRIGVPAATIPKGPAGEPVWPASVVGSITHCAGYVAAATARRADLMTVGIDAEPNEPLPDGVLALTASSAEITRLRDLAMSRPWVQWGRLSFCAKEATYKAWFPVRRCWLGFEDVDVRIDPDGRFRARLLPSAPAHDDGFAELGGRWTVDDGVLLAAVALPAEPG